ncbi:sugar O-acetyltransferase [Orbus sturtevantii]
MATEKEKMLSALLYHPAADELNYERLSAQDYCFKFNQLEPSATQPRLDILHQLLNNFGFGSIIMPGFWCDYGYNIRIGDHFFANFNCIMLDAAPITFGDHVLIGPNCSFYTSGHPLDVKQRNSGVEYAYPITVGNNVWFGGNVVVLPGITIGDNCVIGAGSIITKSIADNSIAIGNPCRVKRSK